MSAFRMVAGLVVLLSLPQLVFSQPLRPDAEQLIKQRREVMLAMHINASKIERMVYQVEPYNAADARRAAANLVQLSSKAFGLFPPGSQGKDSIARPELWQRPDDFNKFSAASVQSISELAAASSKDNLEQLKVAHAKVPPACVACHQAFRVGG
jgi:cytochrome c556